MPFPTDPVSLGGVERRYCVSGSVAVERAEGDATARIVGLAAAYWRKGDEGTEFEIMPGVRERIMAGAFDRAVTEGDDVRALFNHDPSFVLGRRSAGTLRLWRDDVGLRYSAQLPDTQVGRDVAVSVGRGDVTGSSFAFALAESDQRWIEDDGVAVREIVSVSRLYDVSPVTFPAYGATAVGLRSGDGLAEVALSLERWRAAKALEARRRFARKARARVVELENDARHV